MALEQLANIATTDRRIGDQTNTIPDPPRDHTDLVLAHQKPAQLGLDVERAGLGDDERVAVERREGRVGPHRLGYREDPDREPCFRGWVAVARE